MTNEELRQEKKDFRNFAENILNPALSKKHFYKVYVDMHDYTAWFYCDSCKHQYCFYRYCDNQRLLNSIDWIDYRTLRNRGLNDQEILQEIIKYYDIGDMLEGE